MKVKKQYESPVVAVVELVNEGVICSSLNLSNPFDGFTEEEL